MYYGQLENSQLRQRISRYFDLKLTVLYLELQTNTILVRDDRPAAVVAFSCGQIKLLKAFV